MITYYLTVFLIISLMSAVLACPAVSVSGALNGLLTWFNSVLPSLFPFMVLTGLLTRRAIPFPLSRKVKRTSAPQKTAYSVVFSVITGFLCGYPMGIISVKRMKQSGGLTCRQAEILEAFVNQPGPMFILGYAFPLCGSYASLKQFICAFYGGAAATAVTAFLSSEIKKRKTVSGENAISLPENLSGKIIPEQKASPPAVRRFSDVFEETIMSSAAFMIKIGGCMMMFSMIASLTGELLTDQPFLRLIIGGILEMTSGLSLIPDLAGPAAPYFVLAFISFGGLSVAAQSFSAGQLSSGEQIRYLIWKTIQSAITLGLWAVLQSAAHK